MRRASTWLRSFLAEIVVLLLLASGVVLVAFDDDLLGAPDPVSEPAAVPPPVGLRLTTQAAAPPVASSSREVAADPAAVAAALRPLLPRPGVLGRRVGVRVVDLRSGRVVFGSGAAAVTPASTTKLLTTAAALESLGPMARFSTTVRWDAPARRLVLVGGGDPFLVRTPREARATYPVKADLTTLARRAARTLLSREVRQVRLAYDDSLFDGPAVNPAWPRTYVAEGVVPPISALWVAEGRRPGSEGFVADPSAEAARVFAVALRRAGVQVAAAVVRARADETSAEIATVQSPPLGQIVERVLGVSDNQGAEVLARHVGLAERQQGSFAAGASAVLGVLEGLGVDVTGDRLYDGSGLSRRNLLSTSSLAEVLRLAASEEHPDLRQVLTGLPVAGFTGSLAFRFDRGPAEARGRVRAKTGTLTGVHALAGLADDASGARMAFVIVADRVRLAKNLEAQGLIDRIAGALGACRCGVGSGP